MAHFLKLSVLQTDVLSVTRVESLVTLKSGARV